MKDTLQIGSVGTSSIMEIIQDAISLTEGMNSKIIYSRDVRRGQEFAEKMGVPESCCDYEAMLKRSDVDVIYIASPNKFHFEQAKQALEHSKHVIVEKPVAVTKAEVECLYETAKANDVFFFEAITTLFMPNFLAVKEQLAKLGTLEKVWISFGKYSSKYDAYLRGENPNIFNPEMQTGALNDMGIYCIHAAVNLFGKPKSVRYEAECGPNGIDLAGTLYLEYSGLICELQTAKHKDIPCGFLLQGEKGRMCGSGHLNEVPDYAVSIQGELPVSYQQQPVNRMIYEMARFRDAIMTHDKGFFEEMATQSMIAASILEQAHNKMRKYDVIALGELLIDFTDNGLSDQGNTLFEANPGGAPCNVLAMLTRLGHVTGFIGKVGKDIFGSKLKDVLEEVGIDTTNLVMDEEVRTTLAFVQTLEGGDRDFSFYRNPGADMMLTADEVNEDLLKSARVFHFGTLSLTHDKVREATRKAVTIAKENGAIISLDPNLRPPLWKSLDDAKMQVAYGLSQCDVLKISDNEIQWFTGEEDYDAGIAKLREQYPIPLILLSMGRDGSRAYYKDLKVEVPPFLQENTIETTGAGDTFGGSCLHFVLKYGLDNLDEEKLTQMLTFANAAASIITTRKGALRVMPTVEEVEALVKTRA